MPGCRLNQQIVYVGNKKVCSPGENTLHFFLDKYATGAVRGGNEK